MLYDNPTTRERSGCINPEIENPEVPREVTVRDLALEAILNSLPDRSGNSSSDTSSDK